MFLSCYVSIINRIYTFISCFLRVTWVLFTVFAHLFRTTSRKPYTYSHAVMFVYSYLIIFWFVFPLYYDRPPTSSDILVSLTIAFAVSTGCIGADLKMIPNQPLLFTVIVNMLALFCVWSCTLCLPTQKRHSEGLMWRRTDGALTKWKQTIVNKPQHRRPNFQ